MHPHTRSRASTTDAIQSHGFVTAHMLQRYDWQQMVRETAARQQAQKTGDDGFSLSEGRRR